MRRSCTIVASFLALLALSSYPFNAGGQEAPAFRIKYLFSIDGKTTGIEFRTLNSLYLDDPAKELYVLDLGNNRVVITDLEGTPLYNFTLFKTKEVIPADIVVDEKGRVLVAGGSGVAIFDYRGKFQRYMDLSSVPERENLGIQSIAMDGDGNIYLGAPGRAARIVTLDSTGAFISQIEARGRFINVKGLTVTDNSLTFLDSGKFTVWRLDKEGNEVVRFGKLSSLLGGFSQPVGLAVDEKRERILVVDSNRLMVVIFDLEGNPLFEFGGPRMFRGPRTLAVDARGRIYVADGTGIIRVFEVVEDQ
jgi:sugar lactone lactonase YvrE